MEHLRMWIPAMIEKVRVHRYHAKRSAVPQPPPPRQVLLTNISTISFSLSRARSLSSSDFLSASALSASSSIHPLLQS
ncbi:hypothetical protein BD310DRAFT_129789 [Dichomitus squalens]|uniref:Uncharacterized protein n=1 Tax=Dichomitus squalens TaxID=114155 RepID=A0A4Q9PI96_9APHY|nr:hypothetical protein BD310DRAFT_129789 [Dichomitus squalens]